MKERQIILHLVAEGKITPEEADALLAALESDPADDTGAGDDSAAGDSGPERGDGHANGRHHRHGRPRRKTYTYSSTTPGGRRGTTTASSYDFSDLENSMAELGRTLPEVTAAAIKGVAKGLGRLRTATKHIKYGIHIDRYRVTGTRDLSMPAHPGDFLILDIPLGDVSVQFADVTELQVRAKLNVWGSSKADAQARLDATKILLERQDTAIVVSHVDPKIKGVGVVVTREVSVDYDLTVPHGVHLRLTTKAGDIAVTGAPRGRWELDTRLGDIRLVVGDAPDMSLQAETALGSVQVELDGKEVEDVRRFSGTFGSGQAAVHARTRLGDVEVSHQWPQIDINSD